MATKKTSDVKVSKTSENKIGQQNTQISANNERPQYKVPFISAKIDRINDNRDSKIKANASVVIGNHFAVHGIKVYDGGDKGLQVLYPGHKGTDNKYYDDFHPISKEARETVNEFVINAYEQKLEQSQEEQSEDESLDEDEEPAFEQTM